MDRKETKEYIKLQLPIIKAELQQATNKLNTFIAVFATTLAFLLTNIIFVITLLPTSLLYWILLGGLIISLLITSCLLFKHICKRRPMFIDDLKEWNESNNVKLKKIDNGKVNLYYFKEYTSLNLDEFLGCFNQSKNLISDKTKELDIDALTQIYLNSINVVRLYKRISIKKHCFKK